MFADVGHHQPRRLTALGVGAELFDELDVPPVDVGEAAGVVVAVAAEDVSAPCAWPAARSTDGRRPAGLQPMHTVVSVKKRLLRAWEFSDAPRGEIDSLGAVRSGRGGRPGLKAGSRRRSPVTG